MNIIFDLDGTLICAKERLFRLFDDLVFDSSLSFDQYWTLKFARLSNEDILSKFFNYPEREIENFKKKWMRLIEDDAYLKYDQTNAEVIQNLRYLANIHNIYVCTARQSRKQVVKQIAGLGFGDIFNGVLVTERRNVKSSLIREHVKNLSKEDWIVGDTGNDINVGKELEIKTCAVLSGFMNKFNLLKYEPSLLIESVGSFLV